MTLAGLWAIVLALVPAGVATDHDTPTKSAQRAVAAVLCVEAGYNAHRDTDRLRGALVAHVIEKRVKERRSHFGNKESRIETIRRVLFAPNQWGHDCPVPFGKLPGSMRDLAYRLVTGRMHYSPAPDWMTDDVLFVVSEREVKRLEKAWAGKRILVRVVWGLAFYRNVKR